MSNSNVDLVAADWLARLDGEPDASVREQFDRWRSADPRHEVAYLRLKATSQRLDRLRALRPPLGLEADPDFLAAPVTPGRKWARPVWGWSALAAGVVGLTLGLTLFFRDTIHEDRYQTGIGGFERVVLADGSTVEMNTSTQVVVSFGSKQRKIELLAGEATFNVLRDAKRPFTVVAGQTTIRSLGTQFNVRRDGDAIDVIVTNGKVAVGPAIVNAGQAALVVLGNARVRTESPQDAERELAWQNGMLMFANTPLKQVIAEFNRYNHRQLVIGDPAIADREIGGYFKSRNLDSFVRILQGSFGVNADVTGDRIILRAGEVGPPEKN